MDPAAWDVRGDITLGHGVQTSRRGTGYDGYFQDIGGINRDAGGIRDWLVARRTIHFFRAERDASLPFFAAAGFVATHWPMHTTEQMWAAHSDESRFQLQHTPLNATWPPPGSLYQNVPKVANASEALVGHRMYYASMSFVDQQAPWPPAPRPPPTTHTHPSTPPQQVRCGPSVARAALTGVLALRLALRLAPRACVLGLRHARAAQRWGGSSKCCPSQTTRS